MTKLSDLSKVVLAAHEQLTLFYELHLRNKLLEDNLKTTQPSLILKYAASVNRVADLSSTMYAALRNEETAKALESKLDKAAIGKLIQVSPFDSGRYVMEAILRHSNNRLGMTLQGLAPEDTSLFQTYNTILTEHGLPPMKGGSVLGEVVTMTVIVSVLALVALVCVAYTLVTWIKSDEAEIKAKVELQKVENEAFAEQNKTTMARIDKILVFATQQVRVCLLSGTNKDECLQIVLGGLSAVDRALVEDGKTKRDILASINDRKSWSWQTWALVGTGTALMIGTSYHVFKKHFGTAPKRFE